MISSCREWRAHHPIATRAMATGAKKPAAADTPAPAPAAAAGDARRPTQQQALFEAKHAEVLSEARDMARECDRIVKLKLKIK